MNTPWGASNYHEKYGPGITFYGTASHGGFKVSDKMNAQVPQFLKDAGFNGQPERGWYEEDCDWAILALVFPDAFPVETHGTTTKEIAEKTLGYFHPDALKRWEEQTPKKVTHRQIDPRKFLFPNSQS